jgi:hypothetical protein
MRSSGRVHHSTLATEARHTPGTWHGGAPRGGPQSNKCQTQHKGAFTSTADAACLGWQRCSGASRAARVVARSWGNGDTPTLGGSKARTQARPGKGNNIGEGKDVVHFTLDRWWSHRRIDEEGGAV